MKKLVLSLAVLFTLGMGVVSCDSKKDSAADANAVDSDSIKRVEDSIKKADSIKQADSLKALQQQVDENTEAIDSVLNK